jgi:MFS family permease
LISEKKDLPNKTPFYYGWVIWVVGTIGIIATAPGQSYSVSLFIDHIIEDLSLSRSALSSYYGIGTLIASLTLTWVGKNIDKHGNRKVGVIVSILFAITLILFSKINSTLALLFGFIGIRGLGQGSLSMVSSTAISKWFNKKRGRVLSYAIVLLFIFQSFYIPKLQILIENIGWRQAWVFLGIAIAVTILPTIWIFMRNTPEDFNLIPDGVKSEETNEVSFSEENWTLKEVQKTPLFWVFLLSRAAPAAFGTGLIFHQLLIFSKMGHSASVASATFSKISLITAGVSLFSGYLVDNWKPGKIIAIQLVSLAGSMIVAMTLNSSDALLVYAIFMGLMMGTGSTFDGAVWANLFGRKHIGAIRGFVSTILAAGTAIGPVLFGFSFDLYGEYAPAFIFGVSWCLLGFISSLLVAHPAKQILLPSEV